MGGGGGLLGGIGTALFGDGGASDAAAATQASVAASTAATDKSLDLQKYMYEDTKNLAKPMYDLGLSAAQQAFGGVNAQGKYYFDPSKLNQYSTDQAFNYQNFNGPQLGNIAGQYQNTGLNPNLASQYQSNALSPDVANQYNGATFNQNMANQYATNAQNAGNFNYAGLNDVAGQNQAQSFNPNIDITQDPSFKARVEAGVAAADRSASARGMLLSGAQQKAITGLGQQMASEEYANAYNRALQANSQNNAVSSQNYSQALGQQGQQYSQALGANQQNQSIANQNFNQALGANSQNFNNQLALAQYNSGANTQNLSNLSNLYNMQNTANTQNLQNQIALNQQNNAVSNQNFNNQLAQQNQQYSQALSGYQQNYQNALAGYNSDVNLGTQRYNQLASVLGLGQTSQNQLVGANSNYANQYTNTQMQNASNLASAYSFNANAQMQAKQQNTQNMLSLAQTGAMAASDIRLKTNIALVGQLENGLNVYDFDYIWGGERQRGVMAQEVMAVNPSAVIMTDSGYYAVDYSKIGA